MIEPKLSTVQYTNARANAGRKIASFEYLEIRIGTTQHPPEANQHPTSMGMSMSTVEHTRVYTT